MAELLENVTGKYFKSFFSNIEPSAKEMLAETVVSFSPFVPFSKSFSLRIAKRADATLLVPDDMKKDPAFMEQVALYEAETGDPQPPNTDASKTVQAFEQNPDLTNRSKEIAKLLQNATAFAFGESDVKRSNVTYAGEVAFDSIAKDVFDKLPESSKKDIFNIGLASKEIQKGFFSESFDIGMRTVASREKLHTTLSSLSKAGFSNDKLRNVGGVEITIAYKKRMQKFYNDFAKEGASETQAFKSGAQKYVDELNSQVKILQQKFNRIGDFIKLGGKKLKEISGLEGSAIAGGAVYEINQALRRVADMNAESLWKGKNSYLYTVPIKTASFTGQGVANIAVNNRRDFPNMEWVLVEAAVVPTSIAGGLETVVLEQNADVLGIEEGALNQQFQTYLDLTATEWIKGIYDSTTYGRAFDPMAPVANSIGGYGIMSQVMTDRQLTEAIIHSFKGVKAPMTKHVARVYEKMINEANQLSKSWQQFSSQHIWKNNFDYYQFGNEERAEVWKGSNYWTDKLGEGMVVSPLLGTYSKSMGYNSFKDRISSIGK
jgi:hypothetical protein